MLRVLPPLLVLASAAGASAQEAVYRLRVEDLASRTVFVEAEVPASDRILTLGEGHTQPEKERWSDYVDELAVETLDGQPVRFRLERANRWKLSGRVPDRVRLRYSVRLEHDLLYWPPSHAEATFLREDCAFFRLWAVLIGSWETEGGRISFDLPSDWHVTSTLERGAGALELVSEERHPLFDGGVMLGRHTAAELEVGNVRVQVAVAADLPDAIDAMRPTFEQALEEATAVFGASPESRYVIFAALAPRQWYHNSGAGLGNGMAVLVHPNPAEDAGGMWGGTLIHELIHMWCGSAIQVRAEQQSQWFSEGFTDYLTYVVAGRRDLLRDSAVRSYLGRMWKGYTDLAGQRSLMRAGLEKSRFYDLVYGGGLYFGWWLDLELRRLSGGELQIDDLMQALYDEFAGTGREVRTEDIERAATRLVGEDLSPLFDRYVRGKHVLSTEQVHTPLGLVLRQIEQNGVEYTVLVVDPDAPQAAHELRARVLGID